MRKSTTQPRNDPRDADSRLLGNSSHAGSPMPEESNTEIITRLDRLDERMAKLCDLLSQQRTIKDWYTTAEVGAITGKSEYTVREWCRQRRVQAKKRPCGRGKSKEWVLSHAELERLRNEGLLPDPRPQAKS